MPSNKNSFIVSLKAYIVRNWERENSSIISRKTLVGSWGGDIYLSSPCLTNKQKHKMLIHPSSYSIPCIDTIKETWLHWDPVPFEQQSLHELLFITKVFLLKHSGDSLKVHCFRIQENYTWSCYKWGIIKISIMIVSGMKSAYKKHK